MREYVKPTMEGELFAANEYIAACGDMEYGKYLFNCDAPGGTLYYYDKRGKSHYLGGYHPCNEKHAADFSDEFPDGFVDYNNNHKEDKGEAVIVWLEKGFLGMITDWHATTNLDRESWEELAS